mgnify:CR=1 FL=1
MLNLVTVVGQNTHMLPHMLKHYKNIVDNIYVVVYQQHKNDGILDEIKDLGIDPYMVITEPKYNWNKVTEIYNFVKKSKPNDWWIVSDDDELQIYPYDIDYIIRKCEKNNYTFVTGGFVDRIGDNGTFPKIKIDTNIHKTFPYAGFIRYPMSKACPNKVTLMKGFQEVTPGQHYAKFGDSNSWGRTHINRMPIDDVFVQVHHFKWDYTCKERIKDVSNTKFDYTFHWEYEKLYNRLERENWQIDVNNHKFFIEKLDNLEYMDFNDYSKWNIVKNKIVLI